MWAKIAGNNFRYPHQYFQYGGSNMDTQLNKLENPMLRSYLVSKAHKNKIPTGMPMFSGMTFSMAIIFISPGVAITPEINRADKKRK